MKHFQIKKWTDGTVIFEGEYETLENCLEDAVRQGISLAYADLSFTYIYNANLSRACFYQADFYNTEFYNTNLSYANFYEANLSYTDFKRSNLSKANLSYANLSGADLRQAIIADGFVITYGNKFHQLNNVGSENGTLELYLTNNGWFVKRGCFSGSVQEFLEAVNTKHGDNEYGVQYRRIIDAFCV